MITKMENLIVLFNYKQLLGLMLRHKDGKDESITLNHTYNEAQIEWFKAGSALNLLRKAK